MTPAEYEALANFLLRFARQVLPGGKPVPGVTISATGDASASAVTADDGTYSLSLPAAGSYVLSFFKPGFSFPSSPITVNSLVADVPVQDVAAAPTQALLVVGGAKGYVGKGDKAVISLNNPPQGGHVSVRIYTLHGARLVRELGTDVQAGVAASVAWDCHSDGAGSGIYIAVINGAGYHNEKLKIGVLK